MMRKRGEFGRQPARAAALADDPARHGDRRIHLGCRNFAPLKPEATEYLLRDRVRDILGAVGLGIDDALRIGMLAGHQVGHGGLVISAVDVGLGEGDAVPPELLETT